jgi:hypothetical protein
VLATGLDQDGGPSGVAIAGRYLAWSGLASGEPLVQVVDRTTGENVSSFADPSARPDEAGGICISPLDLATDGTLTVTYFRGRNCSRALVRWVSMDGAVHRFVGTKYGVASVFGRTITIASDTGPIRAYRLVQHVPRPVGVIGRPQTRWGLADLSHHCRLWVDQKMPDGGPARIWVTSAGARTNAGSACP